MAGVARPGLNDGGFGDGVGLAQADRPCNLGMSHTSAPRMRDSEAYPAGARGHASISPVLTAGANPIFLRLAAHVAHMRLSPLSSLWIQ